MSEPSREQAIAEAKANGWKLNQDNEWQEPAKKKKKMARKMGLLGKLKKQVKESAHQRKHQFDVGQNKRGTDEYDERVDKHNPFYK